MERIERLNLELSMNTVRVWKRKRDLILGGGCMLHPVALPPRMTGSLMRIVCILSLR